jgi:hypothetical protein
MKRFPWKLRRQFVREEEQGFNAENALNPSIKI